ncbi:MAG: hypothetical protein P8I87_03605 [Gammaproteobacteria bacterium]|nr:hypothetical protein [Gammaproteobacteria bacterium]
MEWTQIAAWFAWAWVGVSTFFAVASAYGGLFFAGSDDSARVATAMALNAILGLMLIQILGLSV